MYKVIKTFADKTDSMRIYLQGAEYPQGKNKPTKARIKQLVEAGFIEQEKEQTKPE